MPDSGDRAAHVAGGKASLRIDADGNGVAETEIVLLGITTLTAADFAL